MTVTPELIAAFADGEACLIGHEGFAAAPGGADFVDEQVAHDLVYPAVEARSRLPLVATRQRPFDRHLAQIVGIRRCPGQAIGEPPHSRQQVDEQGLERLCQGPGLSDG